MEKGQKIYWKTKNGKVKRHDFGREEQNKTEV